jgi:hypothetical protein
MSDGQVITVPGSSTATRDFALTPPIPRRHESIATRNTINSKPSQKSQTQSSSSISSTDSAVPRRLVKQLPDLRMIKYARQVKRARKLTIQRLELKLELDKAAKQLHQQEQARMAKAEAEAKLNQATQAAEQEQLANPDCNTPKSAKSGFFKSWKPRNSTASAPSSLPTQREKKSRSDGDKRSTASIFSASTPISAPTRPEFDTFHALLQEFSLDVQDAFLPKQSHFSPEKGPSRQSSVNSSKLTFSLKSKANSESRQSFSTPRKRPLLARNPIFDSTCTLARERQSGNSMPMQATTYDTEKDANEAKSPLAAQSNVILSFHQTPLKTPSGHCPSRTSITKLHRTSLGSSKKPITLNWNILTHPLAKTLPKPITPVGMPVMYPFNVIGPPTRDRAEAKREWKTLWKLSSTRPWRRKRSVQFCNSTGSTVNLSTSKDPSRTIEAITPFLTVTPCPTIKLSRHSNATLPSYDEEIAQDSSDNPPSGESSDYITDDDSFVEVNAVVTSGEVYSSTIALSAAARDIPDHLLNSPLCPLNKHGDKACPLHGRVFPAKLLRL